MKSIPDKNKISKRGVKHSKYSIGIGYLMVPEDIDRELYIINCFRNGTISFITENGERFDNVKITESTFNYLTFPNKDQKIGSQILYNIIPNFNTPVVVGTLTKSGEVNLSFENNFDLSKRTENSLVSIMGDAKNGNININVDSFQDSGGNLNININNKSKTGKFKLAVNGNIELESTNELLLTSTSKLSFKLLNPEDETLTTKFSYEKEIGFKYLDEFKNEYYLNKNNIQFKPNGKFNIGEGIEPILLGNVFKSTFDDFTDIIAKLTNELSILTVSTAMGPSSVPTNVQAITQIALDLNEIKSTYQDFLSQISFTD